MGMIIDKIINNNIISAFDEEGRELVVMGRGLGFGARMGQNVPQAKVEKIFHIRSQSVSEQFKELLANMPIEHVALSGDIIAYAKATEKVKLNQSIYVTLTDHIDFAVTRYRQGIKPTNALLWEIKRFYSTEYQIGLYAVRLIQERLHVQLPEDEAGFIALHFVNAEYGTNIRDAARFPNMVSDILKIAQKELDIKFDEGSLHFERFVTHIKFLLQRIYRKELLEDEDRELAEMMKHKYRKEYECSVRIAEYIERETGYSLSEEEIMYLTIHIRRVTATDED